MNEAQQAAFDKVMEAFLALDWTERDNVYWALRGNDIFCCECGYGSREDPNRNCQCSNDE